MEKSHKTGQNCCITNSKEGTRRKMDTLPFIAWFVSLVSLMLSWKITNVRASDTAPISQSVSEARFWHSLNELSTLASCCNTMPSCNSISTLLWPRQNSQVGFLRCNLRIGATNIKAQAYKSLVCTVLEYSCTVWDPAAQKDIDRLEAVQRRAARFALNQHQRMASAKLMLQELNWPSLEHHEGQHDLACCVKSTVASQQSSANSSSSSPREPGIPTPQLSRGYPLVCFCSWSLFFSLFFFKSAAQRKCSSPASVLWNSLRL